MDELQSTEVNAKQLGCLHLKLVQVLYHNMLKDNMLQNTCLNASDYVAVKLGELQQ